MARKLKPDLRASGLDGSEAAVPGVPPRERGDACTRRIKRPAVCELDPFVAFSEWATPIDDEDYADL